MGICETVYDFPFGGSGGKTSYLAVRHGDYYLVPRNGTSGYKYPAPRDPIVAIYRAGEPIQTIVPFKVGDYEINYNYLFDLTGEDLDAAVMAIMLGADNDPT